jgi:hypothetical protein
MTKTKNLDGVIVSPDDADVMAVYTLLSQRVAGNVTCTYVTHVGEIDLRAPCDFVLVGALQHVRDVIRFYQMAARPVPHVIHLVDQTEALHLNYEQDFPGVTISPIPMPQLDAMDITLKFDEFIACIEAL